MVTAIKNIIFIDIETASGAQGYDSLSPEMQKEWQRKSEYLKGFEEATDRNALLYDNKAGIYAEFGKVVCVGMGAIMLENGKPRLALKSIANAHEKTLLESFCDALTAFGKERKYIIFCGHHIKEFDLPYLCRRLLIHGMPLPEPLQLANKKPWEVPHLDTLELWRFGDYKHFISLSLLAQCLGLPSPKDDIDGSQVSQLFWAEGDLERISTYCLKDVATTARVYFKLTGQDIDFEEKRLT